MGPRVQKKRHLEITKLRKELEQAKKKISNLSHQINILLREKDRSWNLDRYSSGSDKTKLDWRGKLEMEKETGLIGHAQNETDLQNQVQRVNINGGSPETRATNITSHSTCVTPGLSSTSPIKDVSQIILPYHSAMVAPSVTGSPIPPDETSYMYIPRTLASLISQGQDYFQGQPPNVNGNNVVPSVPTQSQFCVQPNKNNRLTSMSIIYKYQTQVY